ncbi:MAG: aryl-sulfate sulfotransferase [Deltaproteobacteria bacterium]|nr:aryl-sulfate sulfotransferase [Deltaproteobacteria bacterium]
MPSACPRRRRPVPRALAAAPALGLLVAVATACSAPAPSVRQVIAASISARNVKVTWEPLPGQEVVIERAPKGGEFARVARKDGSRARFLDLGLQPATEYRYRLKACTGDVCGAPAEPPPVTTLVSYLTPITVTVPGTSADDVVIFGAYPASVDPSTPGQLVVVDRAGTVLWEVDSRLGFFVEVQPLADGTLAVQRAADLLWYDLDQTVLMHYAGSYVHHDIDQLADGRFAFIAYDLFEPTPGVPFLGDSIRILGQDHNTIDWQWRCRDYISTTELNQTDWNVMLWGMGHDWTHANTIVFDEPAGRVYLSIRNLNRLYAVDYPSGEVAWIMGDGGDFGAGLWDHAHGFEFTAPNRFLVLDNGTQRPGTPKYSRVIEVEFDADTKTAAVVWEYRETPDFYSPFLGSAEPQANGDVLVADGTNGRLFQVSRDQQVTWELQLEIGTWTYKAVTAPRARFTEW